MAILVEKNERYIAREQFLQPEINRLEIKLSNLQSEMNTLIESENKDEDNFNETMQKNIQVKEIKEQLRIYDDEMQIIQKKKYQNLKAALEQAQQDIKKEIVEVKAERVYDGDLKRDIAKIFIAIMRQNNMTNQEIKGCFRQGYKIMRKEL